MPAWGVTRLPDCFDLVRARLSPEERRRLVALREAWRSTGNPRLRFVLELEARQLH